MSANEKPTVAFILSLIGGIFILLGGGMMSTLGMMGSYGYGGMMNGYYGYGGYGMMGGSWYGPAFGMMRGYGYEPWFGMFGIVGALFGVAVIASALMLYNHPNENSKWGILILVFSVLSVFATTMGGFGVGVILGVLGGVFALAWKPPTTTTK
jgi:hypothetical protein